MIAENPYQFVGGGYAHRIPTNNMLARRLKTYGKWLLCLMVPTLLAGNYWLWKLLCMKSRTDDLGQAMRVFFLNWW